MHGNRSLCLSVLTAGLMISSSAGCRAINTAPLESLPSYQRTLSAIQNLRPLTGSNTARGEFLAGGARIDITPPIGTPLAGYGNRLGRGSTGVHDRIYARALALSSGGLTVIILANDVLAITDDISRAVYRKVSGEIAIRPDALLISASHTHSGPGGVAKRFWEGFAAGPFDRNLFEWLTDRMAEAAVRAHRTMRPARFADGSVAAPDLIRNRMTPGGPTDPAVEFVVIETLDRGLTLYLVNYSAHATVLKDGNYLVSGDYPGAIERELEREGGVIALFTAGAVADQTASPPPGKDGFDQASQMGGRLAGKVRDASRGISLRNRIRIRAIKTVIDLPPTQVKTGPERGLAPSIGNLFFDRTSVIQAILIGHTMLIGVPCDLSAETGLEIKARLKSEGIHGIVVGFANDYIGYVIPERAYYKDAYEARMSFYGPHMDAYIKRVTAKLARLITPSEDNGEEFQ